MLVYGLSLLLLTASAPGSAELVRPCYGLEVPWVA